MFSPDLSADLYEKWIGFLAIISSAIALTLLTGIIAYFTTGATLATLQNLGHGLTLMRKGNYEHLIPARDRPRSAKCARKPTSSLAR